MPELVPRRRPGAAWPSAVVFDFDGLLADTNACWRAAYERCLARRNRELDRSTLRQLAGASVSTAASTLVVPRAELARELATCFAEVRITAMPGAATLVRALRGRACMAVATNGPERLVRLGLSQIGLDDAFDTVVSAEGLPAPKPAPDVYLAACSRLDVHPSDAVAVEDSATGAEAAARAGLIVIYIPSDNSISVTADLSAPRLDDRIVMRYLGLESSVTTPPPMR